MSTAATLFSTDLPGGRIGQIDARATAAQVVEAHRQPGHAGTDDGDPLRAPFDLVVLDDGARGPLPAASSVSVDAGTCSPVR